MVNLLHNDLDMLLCYNEFMRYSNKVISNIKTLRSFGKSIPEISRICAVSKTTALRHSKNVNILPQYYQSWLDKRKSSIVLSNKNWVIAQSNAEKLIKDINIRDIAIIGAMLYWAEGAKKDFSFCNSDPEMVKLLIYSLKTQFNIPSGDIKISIRLYENLDKNKCIKYWSKIVGFNLDNNVSINVLKGSKKGKLVYGMCRVRVIKGGFFLKSYKSVVRRINRLITWNKPSGLTK